ncbi:MAG: amidohydrolase family protein [Lautropia sp.]
MNKSMSIAGVSNDFIAVRADWLALEKEEPVLEPSLPIVDPHHHFWDRDRAGGRYLLDELIADSGSGHNVQATVFVECRVVYREAGEELMRSLGETEFVNGIAAMSASGARGPIRAAAGIVGNVDLRFGDDVQRALDAHISAAGGRFKGIRNGSAWHPDGINATSAKPPPGLLLDPDFRRGFACLKRSGLSFDAWLLHTQLSDVIDLAQQFPDTLIILDHVGGPLGIGRYLGQRDEVFADWKACITRLARCENVNVKLGGLGMHTAGFDFHSKPRPPSSLELARAWRPYIETCIEAFGAHRCMFESNFPVDKGSCSYRHLWNAFKHIAAAAGSDEKRALFSGTARRVYKLDDGFAAEVEAS